MKYKFEERLEQNLLSMDVVNARRFAHAVRDALHGLDLEARCYGLYKEDFYLDTKAFLEQMATRLEAKAYNDDVLKWKREGEYTLLELLMKCSGDHNSVKLYECRHSIIGDGAPYPWPEEDLIASAPAIGEYFDRPVHRWEVVDGCLHAVVGFIRGDYEKHY